MVKSNSVLNHLGELNASPNETTPNLSEKRFRQHQGQDIVKYQASSLVVWCLQPPSLESQMKYSKLYYFENDQTSQFKADFQSISENFSIARID